MLDGSSFRVPQGTTQKRFQLADTLTLSRGAHSLRVGGEWQRVDAAFDLGVFQDGRIEFVEDFADATTATATAASTMATCCSR